VPIRANLRPRLGGRTERAAFGMAALAGEDRALVSRHPQREEDAVEAVAKPQACRPKQSLIRQ
jgi:hypothetical protein